MTGQEIAALHCVPLPPLHIEWFSFQEEITRVLLRSETASLFTSIAFLFHALGTSYKFRVRALNILGESEPSAPSKPHMVSGYNNRAYERPVAGPYITFTDAINETTIMLKWMVSCKD